MTDIDSFLSSFDSSMEVDYRAAAASLINRDARATPESKFELIYRLTCRELQNAIPDMRTGNPIREKSVDRLQNILAADDRRMILTLSVINLAGAAGRFIPVGDNMAVEDYLAALIEGIPKEKSLKILTELDQLINISRLLEPKHPSAFSYAVRQPDGSIIGTLTELGTGVADFLETRSGFSLSHIAQEMKIAKIRHIRPRLSALQS